VIVSSRALG